MVFKQLFEKSTTRNKENNWNFLYTGGSKSNTHTGFAVVYGNGTSLETGILFPYRSAFTAEALAIEIVTGFAKENRGKFRVCSDSSTIHAAMTFHNNSGLIAAIQHNLVRNPNKIKTIWVPVLLTLMETNTLQQKKNNRMALK